MRILVSACLLGYNCKYNGKNNLNKKIVEFLKDHEVIPVCPEMLGGLCCPRIPLLESWQLFFHPAAAESDLLLLFLLMYGLLPESHKLSYDKHDRYL